MEECHAGRPFNGMCFFSEMRALRGLVSHVEVPFDGYDCNARDENKRIETGTSEHFTMQ